MFARVIANPDGSMSDSILIAFFSHPPLMATAPCRYRISARSVLPFCSQSIPLKRIFWGSDGMVSFPMVRDSSDPFGISSRGLEPRSLRSP